MQSYIQPQHSRSQGLPVVKWNEIVDDAIIEMEAFEDLKPNKIKEHVDNIKSMLGSMGDGEISCSAYDTAWVALIEDVNGSGSPQFPCTLQWIANNQLPDGSWSDGHVFLAHDRLINTLACVVALKTWNVHRDKYEKGVSFFKDNISKLGDESAEHMPIGFEVAFPSLLDIARTLNIEVPYDCPEFHHIYEQRDLKLTRCIISFNERIQVPKCIFTSLFFTCRIRGGNRVVRFGFGSGDFGLG